MGRTFAEVRDEATYALTHAGLMADVTAHDAYADALVAFFDALKVPVASVTGPRFDAGFAERETFVTAALPDGVLGQFTIDEGWTRTYPGESAVPAEAPAVPQGGRAARVGVAVRAITGGGMRFERILADPPAEHPSDVAFRASVVEAWWKARMAEGHTPESARLLLALSTHPAVLSLLREHDTYASFLTD